MTEPEFHPDAELMNIPLASAVTVLMGSGVNELGGFEAMIFQVTLTAGGEPQLVNVCMPIELAQAMYADMTQLLEHWMKRGMAPPDGTT